MKISAITYIVLSTLILLTVAIFAALELPFNLVFLATAFGQFFLIFSVLRVLKDEYSTQKTFDDFYEDHPIGRYD